MSTLKTHNLQSPDAGSVNISLAPNAGMVVAGISTFTGNIDANGDLDIDGQTHLDHVNVSGATTCNGGAVFLNSISLNASSNNYLYFDDNLHFTRNGHGTEMVIDSNGRLIIGATSTIGNSYSNNFTISESDGNVGMQFAGNNSTSNYASIYFGDAGHRQKHFIETQLGTNGHFTIGTIGAGPIRFTNSVGEILRIEGTGQVTFQSGEGSTDAIRVNSEAAGSAIHISNFRGVTDTGDTTRLGVGKNNNALIFMNASGSQVDNFAIGNTDSVPLVLSTHNKKRFQITGPGIAIFHDNQGSYTNTVQSHAGEGGFMTHYTARTTSGADLYRRMLDIASGGANPHGSSIRFLTSDDNTNPATCVERMRILSDGGVFIGQKTHNQRYPHIESPALLTVQNGARVYPASGVYAAPKGGFCDHARYELEQKLISISNSNLNIVQARNGQPLTINEARTGWSFYSNLPNYLLGHAATDNINNSNFTLTLYANMTVFLLRTNGWNSVPLTGWTLIESDTNIAPASADTRLYVKTLAAGTYNSFDNDSAMYFFVL